jgi:hypothetical protein
MGIRVRKWRVPKENEDKMKDHQKKEEKYEEMLRIFWRMDQSNIRYSPRQRSILVNKEYWGIKYSEYGEAEVYP